MTTEKHVIFGPGALGLAVMDELAAQGKRIVLASRSARVDEPLPGGVTTERADLTDPAQVRRVAADADVVYLCAMPPYTDWPALWPPMMRGFIEGMAGSDARIVYADNLYMYGPNPGVPLTEDLPNRPAAHKGQTRAEVAQMLLDAHRDGTLRATVARAPDFYGPRAINSMFGERFVPPALRGKSATLVGKLDQPHTATFVRDFARALVTLSAHDEALGQVWHVPSAQTHTLGEVVKLFEREMGQPIKVQMGSLPILTVIGWFDPMIREVKEMVPSFTNPYVVDHGKFERAFGATVTPHEEAVRETVAWFRQHAEQQAQSHS